QHSRQLGFWLAGVIVTIVIGWLTQQIPAIKKPASMDDVAKLMTQSESEHLEVMGVLNDIYTIDPARLRNRYPLGYELFYVYGTTVYTPYESTIPTKIRIDWASASARWNDSEMTIQFPNIKDVE